MAAFYNGFQGDEKSLKLIIDNIDKKSILLDGISCLGVVDITDAGDKAYYFKRSSGQVTDGKAGRLVNWNNSGVIRESLDLDDSFQVADFIPMYKTTNTVDIVNDRQAFNAKLIANKHNKKAIEFLIDNATNADIIASDPADGDSALTTITDAIEKFKKTNKVSAMEPTAVYVSNDMAKLLFTSETFAHYSMNVPSEYRDLNGIIAKIDSALIFEAPDVDSERGFYYVVMNYNGFVAPLNLTSWAIKDGVAMGYPTARIIAGETRYNFKITDQNLILVGKGKGTLEAPSISFNSGALSFYSPNASGYVYEYEDSEGNTGSGTGDSVEPSISSNYVVKYRAKAIGGNEWNDSDYSDWFFVSQFNDLQNVSADWDTAVLSFYMNEDTFINFYGDRTVFNPHLVLRGQGGSPIIANYDIAFPAYGGSTVQLDIADIKSQYPEGITAELHLFDTNITNRYYMAEPSTNDYSVSIAPRIQMPVVTDVSIDFSTMTVSWTNPDPSGTKWIDVLANCTEAGFPQAGSVSRNSNQDGGYDDTTGTTWTPSNASDMITALANGGYCAIRINNNAIDASYTDSERVLTVLEYTPAPSTLPTPVVMMEGTVDGTTGGGDVDIKYFIHNTIDMYSQIENLSTDYNLEAILTTDHDETIGLQTGEATPIWADNYSIKFRFVDPNTSETSDWTDTFQVRTDTGYTGFQSASYDTTNQEVSITCDTFNPVEVIIGSTSFPTRSYQGSSVPEIYSYSEQSWEIPVFMTVPSDYPNHIYYKFYRVTILSYYPAGTQLPSPVSCTVVGNNISWDSPTGLPSTVQTYFEDTVVRSGNPVITAGTAGSYETAVFMNEDPASTNGTSDTMIFKYVDSSGTYTDSQPVSVNFTIVRVDPVTGISATYDSGTNETLVSWTLPQDTSDIEYVVVRFYDENDTQLTEELLGNDATSCVYSGQLQTGYTIRIWTTAATNAYMNSMPPAEYVVAP